MKTPRSSACSLSFSLVPCLAAAAKEREREREISLTNRLLIYLSIHLSRHEVGICASHWRLYMCVCMCVFRAETIRCRMEALGKRDRRGSMWGRWRGPDLTLTPRMTIGTPLALPFRQFLIWQRAVVGYRAPVRLPCWQESKKKEKKKEGLVDLPHVVYFLAEGYFLVERPVERHWEIEGSGVRTTQGKKAHRYRGEKPERRDCGKT